MGISARVSMGALACVVFATNASADEWQRVDYDYDDDFGYDMRQSGMIVGIAARFRSPITRASIVGSIN